PRRRSAPRAPGGRNGRAGSGGRAPAGGGGGGAATPGGPPGPPGQPPPTRPRGGRVGRRGTAPPPSPRATSCRAPSSSAPGRGLGAEPNRFWRYPWGRLPPGKGWGGQAAPAAAPSSTPAGALPCGDRPGHDEPLTLWEKAISTKKNSRPGRSISGRANLSIE